MPKRTELLPNNKEEEEFGSKDTLVLRFIIGWLCNDYIATYAPCEKFLSQDFHSVTDDEPGVEEKNIANVSFSCLFYSCQYVVSVFWIWATLIGV